MSASASVEALALPRQPLASHVGRPGLRLGSLRLCHGSLGSRYGRPEFGQSVFVINRLTLKHSGHIRDGVQIAADVHEERAGAGVGEQALGVAVGLQQGFNGRAFLTPLVEQRPTVGQFRSHGGARFQALQLAATLVVGLNDRLAFAHPAGVQRAGVFEGLVQGGASARISRLRLVDRVPEGRAHLLELRFEIAVRFSRVQSRGLRTDLAAGLRQVVSRAVQQSGQAGALEA